MGIDLYPAVRGYFQNLLKCDLYIELNRYAAVPGYSIKHAPFRRKPERTGRAIKMKTIYRTAITIIPKQPYIDWANSFEDAENYDTPHATTILIPDNYDEFNKICIS
jgi:hypothetical protein